MTDSKPSAQSPTQVETRTKITQTVVGQIAFTDKGQRTVWDTQIPGFCLRVGKTRKTYTLQRDFRRDGKRVTARRALGIAAVAPGKRAPTMTVDEARRAALDLIAKLSHGVDPKEEKRKRDAEAKIEKERGITLGEAAELYKASNAKGKKGRPRAPKTQDRYAQFFTAGYLAVWMDRPLRSITRQEVYDRHRALTKEVAAGKYAGAKKGRKVPERQDGRTTADDVFRWFRAVYNRAMRADETLPVNPCINVEWWNVKAERTAIPSTKLATWYEGVRAIPNPVRRDYLLFVLFSGLRRESAATMRWTDVDWTRKVLHIPRPKGGEDRAFDLPLSDYLIVLLEGRRDENPTLAAQQVIAADALEWVWPAYSATGHIAEPREKIAGVPFTIHDLRRSFVTVAESLDISPYVIGALVNHRQPGGSMTAAHVAHEVERLRAPMQRIADQLLTLVSGPGPANVVPIKRRVGVA